SWNPGSDTDSLVEVPGVDQVVAAELLARFRKRTVGHKPLAVTHPNAGRRRGRLQRRGGQTMPAGAEFVHELRGLSVTLLPFGLVQGVLVLVNQQHVFHPRTSISM